MSAKDNADAMDSIVESLYAANKPALGLVGKFGVLTTESKKMEVVMRFLSGTGAWKFLNKLKAVGMMIRGYNEGLDAAAKAQAEAAKEYANEIKAREKLTTLQGQLLHLAEGTLEEDLERKLLQDDMLLGLTEMYGAKKALSILEEQSTKALEQQTEKLEKIKENFIDPQIALELAKKGNADMGKFAEKAGLGTMEGGAFKEFGNFKKFFMTRFKKMSKAVSGVWDLTRGLGKMIGSYLSIGIKALGSFLLWGLAALLLLFVLKSIFMEIKERYGNIFEGIFDAVKSLWSNFMDNIGPVFDAIVHLFKVFFDPNATLMDGVRALGSLIGALLTLSITLIIDTMNIALAALFSLITLAANIVYDILAGIGKMIVGVYEFLSSLVIGSITWLSDKIMGIIEWAVDQLKGVYDKATDWRTYVPGFAAGGTVTSSGNILVGERGPKLLNVPGASKITPNHKLTNSPTIINNNITVEVKGRMGASDQEIRDVARKVGAMINREINRTTSSGVRL